jgi:hypothetical protein
MTPEIRTRFGAVALLAAFALAAALPVAQEPKPLQGAPKVTVLADVKEARAVKTVDLKQDARPDVRQDVKQAPRGPVQLRVEVEISRHLNAKRVAFMPYTLYVVALYPSSGRATLRLGADVPVGTVSTTRNDAERTGAPAGTTTSSRPEYRYVGIQIDASAAQTDDNRFSVGVGINDTSIFAPEPGAASPNLPLRFSDPAAFRTLTFNNTMTFRDGQKQNMLTATDRITGEILMVDVIVSVVK